jgi:Flp pilus assembly protein TadD
MKNICKLTNLNPIICLLLASFLIFGCGKDETPEVVVAPAEVKVEEKVEVKPVAKLPNLGTDAEDYYTFGIDAIKEGNFTLAVQAWEKAVEINPKMVKVYNYLGRAYYTQGMIDGAIDAYKKAAELDPANPQSYINLGITYRYDNEFELAINELNKAIELNPLSALAHDEIGMALMKLEKSDEAIAAFENAIAIDAEFPQPHNNLGVIYLMQGKSKDADKEFKKFEELIKTKDAKQAKIMGGASH